MSDNVYVFPIYLHIRAASADEAQAHYAAWNLTDGPLTITDDYGHTIRAMYGNVMDVEITEANHDYDYVEPPA